MPPPPCPHSQANAYLHTMQQVLFFIWLLSASMILRHIHVVAEIHSLFLLMQGSIPLCGYTTTGGQLDCFQVWATINKTAMNVHVKVFV